VNRHFFPSVILPFLLSGAAHAATINVPANRPTIQSAIDIAVAGDTVLVAPGTYNERIDFQGKAIAVRSSGGAGVTILDAQGFDIAVKMFNREGASTVFEGFTVRNGQGPTSCCWGGGLTCLGCAATIRNNVFENNNSWNGGAIVLLDSGGVPATAKIIGNVFRANHAEELGAAVASMNSNPTIQLNQFSSNTASGAPFGSGSGAAGGAVYVSFATTFNISDNLIEGNSAEHGGGGLFVIESAGTIEKNRVVGNEARHGAGIMLEASSGQITVRNNLIAENAGRNLVNGDTSSVLGGGVGAFRTTMLFENNVVVKNTAHGTTCDVLTNPGGCGFGAGLGVFGGTATIRDNRISDNEADYGGAAWLSQEAGGVIALVQRNRVTRNHAMSRPGLACADGSDCTIDRNLVTRNTLSSGAPTSGGGVAGAGGIDVQDSTALVTNNFLAYNQGQFGGAGKIQRSNVRWVNNTMLSNTATWVGGALIMEGSEPSGPSISPLVANNVFSGNNMIQLHELDWVDPSILNNLFYNSATGIYSRWNNGSPQTITNVTVLNSLAEADNNVAGNPQFLVNAACDEYHIGSSSAGRNLGVNSASGLPSTDIDGQTRILESTVDIGADEYTSTPPGPCQVRTVGIYRDADRSWYLRNTNSGGFSDVEIPYGNPSDVSVVGDWDGDGIDTVGIYRANTFYLRDLNSAGDADVVFAFGSAGDIPVTGDWNGDGTDTIGVYRPTTGTWFLRNSNTGGAPDLTFVYGIVGETPVVGDWNGDGIDTVGIFRVSDRSWHLHNTNAGGAAEIVIPYGDPSIDLPVVGDWNGDGIDTIGVYRFGLGQWYLRNSNTAGIADLNFTYGIVNEKPVTGDWDGR